MSTGSLSHPQALHAQFADYFPEMAVPWQGETAPAPELLLLNEPLALQLGIDSDWLRTKAGIDFLLGTDSTYAPKPVAQAYAGHQFGQFVPQLGDGRALLLGETLGSDGILRDLHLKGSGPTPFSRSADGRAALGPALREFLVSEAMHALGVPTTRSLAVLTTGRKIQRDVVKPAAVLVRVATSHIRIGSFQYANRVGGVELSQRLADYVLTRHFPHLLASATPDRSQLYAELFAEIVEKQAVLAAKWMRLGFVHGVLNTDNTLVSGETIDYGPCAFMEHWDANTAFSSIDHGGRYRFGHQPKVLGWNLARLAETIFPLFADSPDEGLDHAQHILGDFDRRYQQAWVTEIAASLGIETKNTELIDDFQQLLIQNSPDITTLNRSLTEGRSLPHTFADWEIRWKKLDPDFESMEKTNPIYIPRNQLLDSALAEAEKGDISPYTTLLSLVTNPFTRRAGCAEYEQPAPKDSNFRTYCGT